MTVRAVSPVSPYAASVDTTSSVGHSSDSMSEGDDLSAGCLCYSCGNPDAAMDEDFLYLFRPREGHTITLCERSNGNVTEHRLQRVNFGNTRYLRQFLKPDLHHRPLKFDLGQLCRDHQRGYCQRGPMCRFIHICRKLPLKAPSPYQQLATQTNTPARHPSGIRSTPSPTSQGRSSPTRPFVFPGVDAATPQPQQLAFGDNAQAMQGFLAALQASMFANTVSHTNVPNQILSLHPQTAPTYFPIPTNSASPLNAAAAAYTPLFIPQLAVAASTPSFELPRAASGIAGMSLMSQFAVPQMPSMVPSMPSISVTASSPVPSAGAAEPTGQGSPVSSGVVPASIADLWKTPSPVKCVSDEDNSQHTQVNVMLQSLRDFASSFTNSAVGAQTVF